MRKIKVLLADDHKMIRAGLRLVLEQQPDVLVMDIGMRGLNATFSIESKAGSGTHRSI